MIAARVERVDERPGGVAQAPEPRPPIRRAFRLRLRLAPRARLTGLAACVLFLAWQCVAQQAAIVDLSYRVDRLRAEQHAVEQQILRLSVEKARLASLARVERVARQELGMVEPGQVRVVRLSPAGPEGTRAPVMARIPPEERPWWERVLARLLPAGRAAQALGEERP
ncbi:cell division protein FtsL [Limnochorda pilosa]|uniref:Cell division protein FtsL n=1 Tax=Limnochorda pilosa TaxID=1555112 RepID=A0A0K2SKT1_LIMPI|nr:cell division protein FtsL [Limnochorda pilosa]BAS27713.1 hypothetical protein LIP_1870 [Limnochorda pilosa]